MRYSVCTDSLFLFFVFGQLPNTLKFKIYNVALGSRISLSWFVSELQEKDTPKTFNKMKWYRSEKLCE